MSGIGKGVGQVGTGLAQVGAGILRIGEVAALAAVGAVAASAKVGTSFQAMTELIRTQAGASQAEVDAMRTGIMAMVHDVGTTPEALAKGIYHIESVGLRGAKALDVLHASALGAKVGLADMESVTNALTAVTYSNITGTKNASDAMAILDGIVGVGNMHLQDLTDSFKSGILGTGAAFGVSLQSLGAAIATLTDAGVPANIAATRLNMTISHMGAPVPKAIDTLKKLGISQFQLAKDMRGPDGINAALQDIGKHLQGVGEMSASGVLTPQGVADLTKIFGGSRFGATAMQLLTNAMQPTASGLGRIADKYNLIAQRSKTFNDNVEATKQTAGYVWGLLVADIQNAALAFSQGFLPALARAGAKLDAFIFGHLGDIKQLGVDLGAWLDKVDWKSVEDGANTFFGIMKTVLDVIGKIPPQIDAVVVGFLGLNKVSGGLLGKGLGNIVGGVAGIGGALLRSGLSKVPVIGGLAAAATSTPVYITGIAPGVGFGLGGGLPTVAAGAAEGEAGFLASFMAAGALPVLLTAGTLAALGVAFVSAMSQVPDVVPASAGGTPGQVFSPGHGFGPRSGHVQTPSGLDISGSADTHSENVRITQAIKAGFDTADTHSEAVRIAQANVDATLAAGAAIKALAPKLSQAVTGNLHTVLKGIEARSAAKYGHSLGHAAVMGTFERDLLHSEKLLLASHQTSNQKLDGLKHLESLAVAGKDWGVAHKLKADIATLKRQVTTSGHQMTAAEYQTQQAIHNKELSVTVPISSYTTVSLRDITLQQNTYAKVGRLVATR